MPIHPRETVHRARDFLPYPSGLNNTGEAFVPALASLTVTPICAYQWSCHPGWELEPRVLGDSMWFYFLRGEGSGFVGNERFRFTPGMVIFAPEGRRHGLKLKPGASMEMITVHFHARLFGALSFFETFQFPIRLPDPPGSPFAAASRHLARLHALKPVAHDTAMAVIITSALLSGVQSSFPELGLQTLKLSQAGWSRLLPALLWLEKKLDDPAASISDAARHAGVSAERLRRLFRTLFQTSPRRHLISRRLYRAAALLGGTEQSIAEICYACGFNDVPYFYRVFRKQYGCAPAAYRKQRLLGNQVEPGRGGRPRKGA